MRGYSGMLAIRFLIYVEVYIVTVFIVLNYNGGFVSLNNLKAFYSKQLIS